MPDDPHVSVIIPFLNAENFLRSAVNSVISQSFRNWEVILVDDGSTDESTQIAKEFAKTHPEQIRCLEHRAHQNLGTSCSRNLGLKASHGQLVAFLDADDLWLPGMLEHHARIMRSNPQVSISYGPAKWWFGWTGVKADLARDFVQPLGVDPERVVDPPSLVELFIRNEGGIVPIPSGVVFRKDALMSVGAWEDTFTGMFDDQVLYVKTTLKFPAYISRECLFHYRQHAGSLCAKATKDGRFHEARIRFLQWAVDYLAVHGQGHAQLRIVADQRLWYTRLRAALLPTSDKTFGVVRKTFRIIAFALQLLLSKGPLIFWDPTTRWVVRQWARKDLAPIWDRLRRRSAQRSPGNANS